MMNIFAKKMRIRHDMKMQIALLMGIFMLLFMSFSVHASEEINRISGKGTATTAVFVRSGPDKSYNDLGQLNKGDTVEVSGETSSGWYQVSFQGSEGYVYKDYLSVEEAGGDSEGTKSESEESKESEEGEPEEGYSISNMNPTWIKVVGIIAVIAVMIAIIVFTIVRMRRNDEYDDEYDDDYDDEYDDDYDDEYDERYDEYDEDRDYEEEDRDEERDHDEVREPKARAMSGYRHRQNGYDEEGEEYDDDRYDDDRYDDDRYEEDRYGDDQYEEDRDVKRADKKVSGKDKRYVIREEDYQIHIDPKFFEEKEPIEQPAMVTGYLARKMQEEEAEKASLDKKRRDVKDSEMTSEKQKELDKAMKKLNELQEEIERLKNQ